MRKSLALFGIFLIVLIILPGCRIGLDCDEHNNDNARTGLNTEANKKAFDFAMDAWTIKPIKNITKEQSLYDSEDKDWFFFHSMKNHEKQIHAKSIVLLRSIETGEIIEVSLEELVKDYRGVFGVHITGVWKDNDGTVSNLYFGK